MNDAGLDLAPFLRLLHADVGAWVTLALVGLILALMAWTSWGSRRALRKCLVLSIIAHVGLLMYGGGLGNGDERADGDDRSDERIQQIRVVADEPANASPDAAADGRAGPPGASGNAWDRPAPLALVDVPLRLPRPDAAPADPPAPVAVDPLAPPEATAPDLASTSPPPEPATVPEAGPDAPAIAQAPARPDEIPPDDAPGPPPPPTQDDPAPLRIRPRSGMIASAAPGPSTRPPVPVSAAPPALDATETPVPPRDAGPDLLAGLPAPAPDRDASAPPPEVAATAPAPPPSVPDADLRSAARPVAPPCPAGRRRGSPP